MLASGLLGLGLASAAAAADDFDRKGLYFQGGGTGAFEEFESSSTRDINSDSTVGFNARGGYRFHRNFSTELEFEWLDEFDGRLTDSLGNTSDLSIDAWLITANAKMYIFPKRIQPFAELGIGLLDADGWDNDGEQQSFVMRAGGGIDIYATRNLAFTMDATYVMPTADLDDMPFVSLSWGILFRL
jgi:opacity protein-like surface antigen